MDEIKISAARVKVILDWSSRVLNHNSLADLESLADYIASSGFVEQGTAAAVCVLLRSNRGVLNETEPAKVSGVNALLKNTLVRRERIAEQKRLANKEPTISSGNAAKARSTTCIPSRPSNAVAIPCTDTDANPSTDITTSTDNGTIPESSLDVNSSASTVNSPSTNTVTNPSTNSIPDPSTNITTTPTKSVKSSINTILNPYIYTVTNSSIDTIQKSPTSIISNSSSNMFTNTIPKSSFNTILSTILNNTTENSTNIIPESSTNTATKPVIISKISTNGICKPSLQLATKSLFAATAKPQNNNLTQLCNNDNLKSTSNDGRQLPIDRNMISNLSSPCQPVVRNPDAKEVNSTTTFKSVSNSKAIPLSALPLTRALLPLLKTSAAIPQPSYESQQLIFSPKRSNRDQAKSLSAPLRNAVLTTALPLTQVIVPKIGAKRSLNMETCRLLPNSHFRQPSAFSAVSRTSHDAKRLAGNARHSSTKNKLIAPKPQATPTNVQIVLSTAGESKKHAVGNSRAHTFTPVASLLPKKRRRVQNNENNNFMVPILPRRAIQLPHNVRHTSPPMLSNQAIYSPLPIQQNLISNTTMQSPLPIQQNQISHRIMQSPLPTQQNLITNQTIQSPLPTQKNPISYQIMQSPLPTQQNLISNPSLQSPLPIQQNLISQQIMQSPSPIQQNQISYNQSMQNRLPQNAMQSPLPTQRNHISPQTLQSPLPIQQNLILNQPMQSSQPTPQNRVPQHPNQPHLHMQHDINSGLDRQHHRTDKHTNLDFISISADNANLQPEPVASDASISPVDDADGHVDRNRDDKMDMFINDMVNDISLDRAEDEMPTGAPPYDDIDCGLLGDIAELTALMEPRAADSANAPSRNCFSEDHTGHIFQLLPDEWNLDSQNHETPHEERSISAFEPCRRKFDNNLPL